MKLTHTKYKIILAMKNSAKTFSVAYPGIFVFGFTLNLRHIKSVIVPTQHIIPERKEFIGSKPLVNIYPIWISKRR